MASLPTDIDFAWTRDDDRTLGIITLGRIVPQDELPKIAALFPQNPPVEFIVRRFAELRQLAKIKAEKPQHVFTHPPRAEAPSKGKNKKSDMPGKIPKGKAKGLKVKSGTDEVPIFPRPVQQGGSFGSMGSNPYPVAYPPTNFTSINDRSGSRQEGAEPDDISRPAKKRRIEQDVEGSRQIPDDSVRSQVVDGMHVNSDAATVAAKGADNVTYPEGML